MKNKIMNLAINEAFKSVRKKEGGPFGAVILRKGKIVSIARSSFFKKKDSTAHAAVEAIRKASKKLKSSDLSECEMITNGEPCPMCFGAIYWAKIKKVSFGAKISDSIKSGVPEIKLSSKEINKKGKWKVKIDDKMMREACLGPFKEFKKANVNY